MKFPIVSSHAIRALLGIALCAVVAASAPDALAQQDPKNTLHEVICKGEFSTGSGVLGSSVGENCFIFADTDQERHVQDVCAQNSLCEVRGMVNVDPDGTRHLQRIISIKQTAPAAR
jgi:hypothetical protein